MRRGLRYALGGAIGQAALEALMRTVRFTVHGDGDAERYRSGETPVIFALWHGRLLPLTYFHRGRGIAAMISRSADGEYISRLTLRWGFLPVRGSSSRGGTEALRELARLAREGRTIAITPDGPRGPRQRMKNGALVAAQLTGLPIVPLAGAADRAWWFDSGWDRFLVPRPFARVHVHYGEPHVVPRDCTAEELSRRAGALESAMNRQLEELDRLATNG